METTRIITITEEEEEKEEEKLVNRSNSQVQRNIVPNSTAPNSPVIDFRTVSSGFRVCSVFVAFLGTSKQYATAHNAKYT